MGRQEASRVEKGHEVDSDSMGVSAERRVDGDGNTHERRVEMHTMRLIPRVNNDTILQRRPLKYVLSPY